jgi:hypothetical protein
MLNKVLCAKCVRIARLSASTVRLLYKAKCCNARKKDLASCTDLLSYVKKGFGGFVLVID